MPSRTDEAGHTKVFGYPVAEHWGGGGGGGKDFLSKCINTDGGS